MRIAYVVTEFPLLSETFVLNQVTRLLDRGHDGDVHVQGRGDTSASALARYQLDRRVHTWDMPWSLYLRYARIPHLLRGLPADERGLLLRAMNPLRFGLRALDLQLAYASRPFLSRSYDVIHCHFGPNGERTAQMKVLGIARSPLVTTFHGWGIRLAMERGPKIYSNLRARGDLFIAISRYSRTRLEELGFDPTRIVDHPMGIALERFPLRDSLPHLARPAGAPMRILSVGRTSPEKGHDIGLRALRRLLNRSPAPAIQYTILGGGHSRPELERLTERLGLVPHVRFTGALSHQEVAREMAEADAFLLPSRAEILPVVLMEALATGLPVVATDVGAVAELVEDGASGFVVPSENPDALADALERLLRSSPDRWRAMGLRGRAAVEARHDINRLNDDLETLLRSVAEAGSRRVGSTS